MNTSFAIALIVFALVIGGILYVAIKPEAPSKPGSHAFQSLEPLILGAFGV